MARITPDKSRSASPENPMKRGTGQLEDLDEVSQSGRSVSGDADYELGGGTAEEDSIEDKPLELR